MLVTLCPARLLLVISTLHSNTSGIDLALAVANELLKGPRQQGKGEEAAVAETLPPWLRQLQPTRYFEPQRGENNC